MIDRPREIALRELLRTHVREGELYRRCGEDQLECYACGHRCIIGKGHEGICKVRFNTDNKLFVPYGYVGGLQIDPIEKKPFFHALPGGLAVSFGMLGCDYHCSFCQNWITSQALRDPGAVSHPEFLAPEDIVGAALRYEAQVVTSTYNEPLITSEWAVEIFKIAKRYGLTTSYVSNGNATPEVIEYLKPWVDLFKVDLKGFNDRRYRSLGGVLQNVLDTIRMLHMHQFWIEVVTLLVPSFNDSDDEIRDLTSFIASVSPDIPWHVTAFHADYKMTDRDRTPTGALLRAAEIGRKSGLRFVYTGNLPGMVGTGENTNCPSCGTLLIERLGFRVLQNFLAGGCCPKCHTAIPGFWRPRKEKGMGDAR